MSTTFVATVHVSEGDATKIVQSLRLSANTATFHAFVHKGPTRCCGGGCVELMTRHDVGLCAGPGAQDVERVARRMLVAVRAVVPLGARVDLRVLDSDSALWVAA